jgi:hypothetical protein
MARRVLSQLEILTRDFCDNFEEQARREMAQQEGRKFDPSPFLIANTFVGHIFRELRWRMREPVVRVAFGRYGPRKPSEEINQRRRHFIWSYAREYAREGKPPKKKTFAREMAQHNARMIKAGKREFLVGSGTTDTNLMHDYLKKTLRVKKWRDMVERECVFFRERHKEQGGG